ncbi:S8 family serine peptidase [Ancylobacter sp. SL191]|uniref:S8 family serine peptidase n=1 Tax=Ancylobacter sp. SL191 TaxID=2995166 RepID=UPI002270D6D9|nr:S8 family serine peptidase [Ancylobacter sp. SL191]WAC27883.1 S8 family serine peptidase [Ancylobacter sp. SL191]
MIDSKRYLYALMAVSAVNAMGDAHADVLVRRTKQASPELVRTIAEVGREEQTLLPAGASILEAVRSRCNTIDTTYLGILTQKNPTLIGKSLSKPMDGDLTLTFPACARAPEAGPQQVPEGATLGKLALDHGISFPISGRPVFLSNFISLDPAAEGGALAVEAKARPAGEGPAFDFVLVQAADGIGANGEKRPVNKKDVLLGVDNAISFVQLNDGANPDRLKAGSVIQLPGTLPVWSELPLAAGISKEAALSRIAMALASDGSPPNNVTVSPAASLVTPNNDYTCAVESSSQWPFDKEAVLNQLAVNKTRYPDGQFVSQTILVADTGFDFVDGTGIQFPKTALRKLVPFPAAAGSDPGAMTGPLSVDGINLTARRNSPQTSTADTYRFHGVGVAGVAIGGRTFEAERQLMSSPIGLGFASVTSPSDGHISPTVLSDALSYIIKDRQISVMNASFTINGRIPGVEQLIKDVASRVVLVVAAGNANNELGSTESWPAMFGGDPGNAAGGIVITVAAHDRDGTKSPFSSWSADRVDLLAPGCGIPSYSSNGTAVMDSDWAGTSFSAPLVSFVAAWLGAYNLNTREIKARMISSVDASDALDDVSYSRGTLNIPRALAFGFNRYDVIVGGKKKTILSKDNKENGIVKLCGKEFYLSSLSKVAKGTATLHVWPKNPDKEHPEMMKRLPLCNRKTDDAFSLNVTDFRTGEIAEVSLDNLIDFTSASR